MIKLNYPKFWHQPNILAYLLYPFSLVFYLLGIIRKITSKTVILPGKVICVGNASVGGTGKTQFVIWLAKLLKSKGISFIIISKAYQSKLKQPILVNDYHNYLEVGDESIILRNYGRVIATKKVTTSNSLKLIKQLQAKIIIIDDGLQNPTFHKDLSILMIDEKRKFGNGFLLPAGPLREYPRNALSKADIIITAGENPTNFLVTEKPKFLAKIIPEHIPDINKRYIVFSGIGDPERFFRLVRNCGIIPLFKKIFPDHHIYSDEDLAKLLKIASEMGACLLTTRKDFIKIQNKIKVEVLDVILEINNNEELTGLIYEKIF